MSQNKTSPHQEPKTDRRVCMRLPLKLAGELMYKDRPSKKITIEELSAGGFSVICKERTDILEACAIRFRVSPFMKVLRLRFQVVNTTQLDRGIRFGCKFIDMSLDQKDRLFNFIYRCICPSFSFTMVGISSFFCLVDSLWRIWAYFFVGYFYRGFVFTGGVLGYFARHGYFIILLLYMCASIYAFMSSTYSANQRGRRKFVLSLFSLAGAFVFVLCKDIYYLRLHIWPAELFTVNFFYVLYWILCFFIGFSLFVGLFALKKMSLAIDLLDKRGKILGLES